MNNLKLEGVSSIFNDIHVWIHHNHGQFVALVVLTVIAGLAIMGASFYLWWYLQRKPSRQAYVGGGAFAEDNNLELSSLSIPDPMKLSANQT